MAPLNVSNAALISDDPFWRGVPLIGLLLFLLFGMVVRSWIHARRYGGFGVALLRPSGGVQLLQAAGIVLLHLTLLGEAIVAIWAPEVLAGIPSFLGDEVAMPLRPAGATLLFGATLAMFLAQLHLGASWRIGIDERARPGLVTAGLYRFCRNPIYLFMFMAYLGFTLLLPNVLSLAVFVGAVIGVRHAVMLEENYLEDAYGDSYREYAHRVGRFTPWVGRLR